MFESLGLVPICKLLPWEKQNYPEVADHRALLRRAEQ